MPQSLSKVLLHLVFSTKNREKIISQNIQPKLHAYLAGACRKLGSEAYRAGGTEDHVHIACTLSRTITIAKLMEEIKKSFSAWVKKQDEALSFFAWQDGYGAFSLGQSQLNDLLNYIDNQHKHHQNKTFKEELKVLFLKYGIKYDERYLWD